MAFPLRVPPIPKPKVSPDLGVPNIPSARINPIDGGVKLNSSGSVGGYVPANGSLPTKTYSGSPTIADPNGVITPAEAIVGIRNIYQDEGDNGAIPQRGDIISLLFNGDLAARYLIRKTSDGAASPETLYVPNIQIRGETFSCYAYSLTATSAGDIIDAVKDYLATTGSDGSGSNPNDTDILPDTQGPDFTITVDGTYTIGEDNVLTPSSTASVGVKGGTLVWGSRTGEEATVAQFSPVSESFGSDPSEVIFAYYVDVTFDLNSDGTASSASAQIIKREAGATADSLVQESQVTYNTLQTQAYKSYLIGTVSLMRKGDRRAYRISQALSGKVRTFSGVTNNGSTVVGVNTDAGFKKIILNINGTPFETIIITGSLKEVT